MDRRQPVAVFAALLLFVSGALVGVLGFRYYERSSATVKASEKTSDDWRQQYMAEMRARVKISDRQATALNVVLDQTKQDYRDMRERHKPEMIEIKQNQIAKVKALLTSDQIPEYEKLLAEREQRSQEQDERDRKEEAKRAQAAQESLKR